MDIIKETHGIIGIFVALIEKIEYIKNLKDDSNEAFSTYQCNLDYEINSFNLQIKMLPNMIKSYLLI